jgi:hypothetical protein
LHYGLVAAGLGFDLAWVLWLAVAVSASSVAVRATQVAREERT